MILVLRTMQRQKKASADTNGMMMIEVATGGDDEERVRE